MTLEYASYQDFMAGGGWAKCPKRAEARELRLEKGRVRICMLGNAIIDALLPNTHNGAFPLRYALAVPVTSIASSPSGVRPRPPTPTVPQRSSST